MLREIVFSAPYLLHIRIPVDRKDVHCTRSRVVNRGSISRGKACISYLDFTPLMAWTLQELAGMKGRGLKNENHLKKIFPVNLCMNKPLLKAEGHREPLHRNQFVVGGLFSYQRVILH